MSNVDVQTIANIVTIIGGTIGLILVLLEIVETWLNIREKLTKSTDGNAHKTGKRKRYQLTKAILRRKE